MTAKTRTPRVHVGWLPLAASPIVLVLASLIAWWLIGDLSSRPPPGVFLDYLVVPPAVDPDVVTDVGVVALALGVMMLLVSVVAVRRGDCAVRG